MATVNPVAITTTSGADAWLWVGPDERGRELEVIGLEVTTDGDGTYLLVLPTTFRS